MFHADHGSLLRLISFLACFLCSVSAHSAEYKKAELLGKADITKLGCDKGDFWDPRGGGECWSCEGKRRTLYPVTSDKACATGPGEHLSRATRKSDHNTVCPDGSFFDPRNGGECWQCPAGTKRSVSPVTSDKACFETIAKKTRKAKYKYNTGSVLKACRKGTFANLGSTKCYECGDGWRHDITKKVEKDGVCYQPAYRKFSKAGKKKDLSGLSCPKGQFYDPIDGGSCWTCPGKSRRTAYSVKSDKACAEAIPEKLSPAKFKKSANVTKLGCDHLGKAAFFDLIDGGTCWECPASNPVRTLYPVSDARACATKTCGKLNGRPCFVWEKIPSCEKGLLENPFENKCQPANQLLCKSMVRTIAEIKELNEKLLKSAGQASDEAIDAIPGARQVLGFVEAQNTLMQEESKKQLRKIKLDKVNEEIQKVLDRQPETLDTLLAFADVAVKGKKEIQKIFLDSELICSGDFRKIDARLKKIGFQDLVADGDPGFLEYLSPVSPAYAASGTSNLMSFSVSVEVPTPTKAVKASAVGGKASFELSYETDFNSKHGLYLDIVTGLEAEYQGEVSALPDGAVVFGVGWVNDHPECPDSLSLGYSINVFGPLGIDFGNCGFEGLSLGLGLPFETKLNPKNLKLTDNLMKGGGLEIGISMQLWADD